MKKILFTFFNICVIFFVLMAFLSGCLQKPDNPDDVLFFSFKTDCPQCGGFKSVKNGAGTLEKCSYCDGLGYVYKEPQGNYKAK